ncbi:MAG: hypothetical protein ACFE8U_14860 [Candidatus Hermodarchaeota archaeon]
MEKILIPLCYSQLEEMMILMIPFLMVQLNALQQFTLLLSWILALFGFFGLAYSIGLLLRNYFRTGSLDYLIFAGIFFFTSLILFIGTSVVQMAPPIADLSDKLILLVYVIFWGIITFLIFLHAFRLRFDWSTKPVIPWYFMIFWLLIYTIAAFLISSLVVISGILFSLSIFVMNISYFVIGLFLTYVYISVAPVNPTARIELVRKVYIMFGVIMMLMSVNQFIFASLFLITSNIIYFSIAMMIQCLLGIIQGLPIIYICVFYPESLLISHVQILRALKLYKKIRKMPIEYLKGDKLFIYLNSIPEAIFDKTS